MSLIEAYSIKNHDSTRPILFEEVTIHIAIQTQQRLATFLEGTAFSCTDIWSHTFRSCIFSVPSPRLHVCGQMFLMSLCQASSCCCSTRHCDSLSSSLSVHRHMHAIFTASLLQDYADSEIKNRTKGALRPGACTGTWSIVWVALEQLSLVPHCPQRTTAQRQRQLCRYRSQTVDK